MFAPASQSSSLPVTNATFNTSTWELPKPAEVSQPSLTKPLGQTILQVIAWGMRRVINVATLMLIIIGLGTVWNATIGDGSLPQLTALTHLSPKQAQLAQHSTTANLPITTIRSSYWEALSSSRSLLLSLSPQLAQWLLNLHLRQHIKIQDPDDIHQTYHVSSETPLLAAYRFNEDTLYLGEAFWKLSDGQKVTVIAHEYRHSRQNFGKRLSVQLAQWMGLGQLQAISPLEDEARDYERQAANALGINPL